MDVAVVGAGPTGLYVAIALARRGHQVTVIERDPGPDSTGAWERRGVVQFHHPHGFREQVLEALNAEMPDVSDALYAAGATPATLPQQPTTVVGLHCRRPVFERALRVAAEVEPRVTFRIGRADAVESQRGRAVGARVAGHVIDADVVIDATGRAGRLTRAMRAPAEGGDCGTAFVSREYELLPGAERGPMNSPIGFVAPYDRYAALVFLQDNRTVAVAISRASSDDDLAPLRVPHVFEAAVREIPALAAWTDPERCRPIGRVRPGVHLYNSYQGQLDAAGRVPLDGLFFLGDAVCTTNPSGGRGVTTSLMQAQQLLRLLDDFPRDLAACSLALDAWCTRCIRPWFDDHVDCDAELVRRWSGYDVDCSRRLPSDLIVAATEADRELMPVVGPYLAMHALPESLNAVEPRARALYADGWRPSLPAGPSRTELAALVAEAAALPTDHAGGARAATPSLIA